MEPVIYNFRLDVAKSGQQVGIVMKAGDRASRKLRITLVNGGSAFIPPEGHTASLKAEKPDGTILLNACEVINGMIEYEVTEQTLAVPGTVSCEVTCYGADGEVLCTPGFEIYAERKVYEDDLIESKDEFTTLSGALGRVSSVEANENARQEAEAERQEVFDESIRLANVAAERANAAADAYDGLLEGADWPPHASSHAIGGRDQITPSMIGAQPVGNYLTGESDPTVPSWAKQPTRPSYTAEDVGAAPSVHSHGALSNDGAVGKTSGQFVVTGESGKLNTMAPAQVFDAIGAQRPNLYLTDTVVPVSSWADDATYSEYRYKAAITIDGVSAENYAEATYAPAEQSSGNYAGVADTYDGGVYIYAKALPSADITIPTIKVEAAGKGNVGGGTGSGEGYTLPIATAETLGGVKPVAATADMTQPVGVDADGALYTAGVKPEQVEAVVEAYLAEHPVQETDPTVPDWAKQPTKPSYTASEVGALPTDTVIPTVPDNVSAFQNDAGYLTEHQDLTGYATEQYVQGYAQPKGNYLTEVPAGYAKTEDIPTKPEDIGAQPSGNYALKSEIPSVPVQSVNGKTGAVQLSAADVKARPENWMPSAQEVGALPNTYTPPNQTAEQVGADPKGTATASVSQHNTADDSHNDIRLELKAVNDRLTAFFDSDNQALDELSEIVAYITSNKSLIDAITTSKVSVADIINNLTTNVSNKPLSASQGVALKGLIDAVSNSLVNYQPVGDYALKSQIPTVPTKVSAFTNDAGYLTQHQDISGKLDASALPTAINTALAQAKASGEFDGKNGYTPVKGTDYFTVADKSEMINDVIAALPVYHGEVV